MPYSSNTETKLMNMFSLKLGCIENGGTSELGTSSALKESGVLKTRLQNASSQYPA
ncbi:hypothetical protein ABG067_006990 [Albugo candida]